MEPYFVPKAQLSRWFVYKSARSQTGFTLLELLVVVIIAGLMAAVATPSLKGWSDQQQVNNSLMKLRTALEQARSNAMRLSKDCAVVIKSETVYDSSVRALVDSYTAKSSTAGCILESVTIPKKSILLQKQGGSLPVTITFDFNGETAVASNATIIISRKGSNGSAQSGTEKCIVVSAPLGMIRTGNYGNSTCINVENLKYDQEH